MKVLNFGSMNYDYVYTVDHIMQAGETQASTSRNTFLGGKGFNQSVALARAGADIYHAGCLGEEGQNFLDACKEYGIKTDYIRTVKGPSGHTVIQIDKNAQNSILLFGGANRMQTREHIDFVISNFDKGDIILLQNEVNELDYIIEKAYEKELTIVLNPSPYDSFLDNCDMNKISIFLVNELEGAAIAGVEDPEAILDTMKEKFPNAKIVLTLGQNGAYYQDKDIRLFQDCFKVKAVDTTAAGDTFTGYFLAGMIKGWDAKKMLLVSSKASSIAVTRNGAGPSIPTFEEVMEALEM